MAKKPDTVDCVDMKQRAQRKLTKALAGKTPAEQVSVLRRLASKNPLWRQLTQAGGRAEKPARSQRKRRSTG